MPRVSRNRSRSSSRARARSRDTRNKGGRRSRSRERSHSAAKKSESKRQSKDRYSGKRRAGRSKDRKRKKRRKDKRSSRRRSSSTESSSSSENQMKSETTANARESKSERRARKLAEKAAMKARETPEERHKRRLAKKQLKDATVFGYTDDNNPFGDSNLSQQFSWKKKDSSKKSTSKKEEMRRKQEKMEEILKVKQRREQREEEQLEMERLRDEEQQLREAQAYVNWEKDEVDFHLKQQKHRSAIRIAEGREKPIDILAKNLIVYNEYKYGTDVGPDGKPIASTLDKDIDLEVGEPHLVFEGLPLQELEQLRSEILGYQQLESNKKDGHGIAFWNALLLVVDDYIEIENNRVSGRTTTGVGIHGSVDENVEEMISGKDRSQLESLLNDIETKLNSRALGIDYDYWQAVKKKVKASVAKAELGEIHRKILVAGLKIMEDKGKVRNQIEDSQHTQQGGENDGSFSPTLEEDEDEGTHQSIKVVNEEEDIIELERQRQAIAMKRKEELREQSELAKLKESGGTISELAENLGDDEQMLGTREEVELGTQTYQWQDKFRPRKPRYFNSVKTGYEWNKYNQTHYDFDNPPPKVVQGYKFNIFYPDLIDKSVSPTFKLEPADSPEFCIIRFHAGPPYEDVAFKIVNQQWEKSRKHGFKCLFDRGNLHLYFNFRRHRYRR